MRRLKAVALAATWMVLAGAEGRAQPSATERPHVTGGIGMATLWDDETFLGRGALLSGGIAQPLGSRFLVEGELAWTSHHRDSGYLAADGHAIFGIGRLSWRFRPAASRVRPFVSAGAGFVRSTGYLTLRSLLPGPGGPIEGPSQRTDWALTHPALELGAGVAIASAGRLSVRPAARWTSTTRTSRNGTLEPPLWLPRLELTMGWRLGP